MSTIEQAARALCLSQSGIDCYDDLEPEAQLQAQDTVRAVLGALREPSEAMEQAGGNAVHDGREDDLSRSIAIDAWERMIDAALSE